MMIDCVSGSPSTLASTASTASAYQPGRTTDGSRSGFGEIVWMVYSPPLYPTANSLGKSEASGSDRDAATLKSSDSRVISRRINHGTPNEANPSARTQARVTV